MAGCDHRRRRDQAHAALGTVIDPELDEPITDLGFVRSLTLDPDDDGFDVEVHLRLPTSFCAPNFAYLMASDAKAALVGLDWTRQVMVELDDHHDSAMINAGLAADAGYRGTFGHEAEHDLAELRITFQRKAYTAAMERCLTALLRADKNRAVESLGTVRLGELPDDPTTRSLLRHRAEIGLSTAAGDLVMVGPDGRGYAAADVALALRRARSTRISIDGNAHFCRGLLRTRYPAAQHAQVHRADGAESADAVYDPTFIPLSALTGPA